MRISPIMGTGAVAEVLAGAESLAAATGGVSQESICHRKVTWSPPWFRPCFSIARPKETAIEWHTRHL